MTYSLLVNWTQKMTKQLNILTSFAAIVGMYSNARCRVRVNRQLSKKFENMVDVLQGSTLSPLLFIIVLEALSCDLNTQIPWELMPKLE